MPPRAKRILAAAALALLALARPALATPEYLQSETPIASSLEELPSATGRFGILPEYRPFEGMLLPSRMLPELRKRLPTSGEPFIDDTIYFVRPRAYYRYRDNGDGTLSEAFAVGGAFGLETGYWKDFVRIGITGYTSIDAFSPNTRPGTGILSADDDSYTVLGEAYADIKLFENANATLFRQRLDLPYINANDSRMIPNTFEAYTFIANPLPQLRWGFGHVDRIKFRSSADFESMSSFAGAPGDGKGVTVAGLRYNFSEKFHASLIEEYGWDTFNTLYAESEGSIPLCDDVTLQLATQFTDQRSVGDERLGAFDTQHAGARASLGYRALIASLGFTWTAKEAAIMKPWGGSPSYNSLMISDFDRAGEKSLRATLSNDFTEIGLTGFAVSTSFAYGETPDSAASPDQREFDINFDYRPPIKHFDNFWFRVRYAYNDRGAFEQEDLRVILNYSFSF